LHASTSSDVNKAATPKAKATTLKAKAKATTPKAKAKDKNTYLAKNTTTFPQHLYRTTNVLRSNLQSSLKISQCSISIVVRLTRN